MLKFLIGTIMGSLMPWRTHVAISSLRAKSSTDLFCNTDIKDDKGHVFAKKCNVAEMSSCMGVIWSWSIHTPSTEQESQFHPDCSIKTWVKRSRDITWTYISVTKILTRQEVSLGKRCVLMCTFEWSWPILQPSTRGQSTFFVFVFGVHLCCQSLGSEWPLSLAPGVDCAWPLTESTQWNTFSLYSLCVWSECDFCLFCIFFLACTLTYLWLKIGGWIISAK